MVKLFEYARWLFCICGFYLAYATLSIHSIYWLCLLVIAPLPGLTAIESLFFAKQSAAAKKREIDSSYQTQSALNNLATASTALIVIIFNLGVDAQIAISLAGILFFLFSSIKHGLEFFLENKGKIHLIRLLSTAMLVAASAPIIVTAWPK